MRTIRLSTALLLVAVVTIGLVSIPQWQNLHAAKVRADDRAAARTVAELDHGTPVFRRAVRSQWRRSMFFTGLYKLPTTAASMTSSASRTGAIHMT